SRIEGGIIVNILAASISLAGVQISSRVGAQEFGHQRSPPATTTREKGEDQREELGHQIQIAPSSPLSISRRGEAETPSRSASPSSATTHEPSIRSAEERRSPPFIRFTNDPKLDHDHRDPDPPPLRPATTTRSAQIRYPPCVHQ
ncbi:hypothetical protein Dimus_033763, partial [Dionaea muscipula]